MFKTLKVLLVVCIITGQSWISSGLFLINATIGSKVTIGCNIYSNETVAEIFWERTTIYGDAIVSPNISGIAGSTRKHPSLIIYVASSLDSGRYTCNLRTHNKTIQGIATTLSIKGAPPAIKTESTSLSGIYGIPITLKVSIKATPLPYHIYWTMENQYGEIKIINYRATGYEGGNVSVPSLTISNPKFTENGVYTCYARNVLGLGYSQMISLIVEGEVPTVSTDFFNYISPFGSSVALSCNVIAFPNHTNIYWRKQKNNVFTHITQDTGGVTGSTNDIPELTIKYVTTYDAGNYTCFAENNVGVGSSRSTLLTATGGAPIIQIQSAMYSTVYGTPVTLYCNVTGYPPVITVHWKKKRNGGEWLTISSETIGIKGINVTQPSLTIEFPVKSDTGEYICFAVNAFGTTSSLSTHLTVTGEKPVVNVTSYSTTAVYGKEITLHCTVQSYPIHKKVYWEFKKNGVAKTITSETSGVRGVSKNNPSLTIVFVTISDDGFYTCCATNEVGSGKSQSIRLSVDAAIPLVVVASQVYSVKEGNSVSVNCQVSSSPRHFLVYWKKENNKIVSILKEGTTGILGITIDDPSITFNPVRREDTGHYICYAVNGIGLGFSKVVTLEVAPLIEESMTENTTSIYISRKSSDKNILFGVIGAVITIAAVVSVVGAWKCKFDQEKCKRCTKALNCFSWRENAKCLSLNRILCCKRHRNQESDFDLSFRFETEMREIFPCDNSIECPWCQWHLSEDGSKSWRDFPYPILLEHRSCMNLPIVFPPLFEDPQRSSRDQTPRRLTHYRESVSFSDI